MRQDKQPEPPAGHNQSPRKQAKQPAPPAHHAVPPVPNPSLNKNTRLGQPTSDEQLLQRPMRAQEPFSTEFTHTDPWRVFRIMGEFVAGFDALAHVSRAVSIFGSARIAPEDPMYDAAREMAKLMAEEGYAEITGGGPGIMEAANLGAREGGGLSIGCSIEL